MGNVTNPLVPLRGEQARAAAPDAHVWLSASAGTGKTHVLTARVFRLLLRGVPPENILCLTFTKAGASEMAERIHSRLAAWVQMSDADLAIDLKALGEDLGPDGREHARRLFARVLEATGGGLRIQTIHSFSQQLLASFPLEAGLVPGFRAMEEREQRELARAALEDMIIAGENAGDIRLTKALRTLSLRLGERGAGGYLQRCARAHSAFAQVPEDTRAWLFSALNLPQGDVETEIAARCADDACDVAALVHLARVNAEWGTKTGLAYADIIARWLGAAPVARAQMLDALADCFVKKDGELRGAKKGQLAIDEGYQSCADDIAGQLSELALLRTRVAYADAAAAALHAGRVYASAYETAKRQAGAVDFDDLIARGAALLSRPGIADWIRYKLDARIDHILVDEAQDTNRMQWAIIGALVEEFFAGEGARGGAMRTLFTVGDFKQAIFGFQGTSPQAFREANAYFRQAAGRVGHDFHDLSLDESFRSTPPVLEVVDAVLGRLGAEALGLPAQALAHRCVLSYPGVAGLLKPISTVSDDGEDGAVDDDAHGEEAWLSDQDRLLAERISAQIRAWLDAKTWLPSKGRALRPGDIMILLRTRGALARLIVARLHEAGVPVAGVDRLRLQAPLGVQDLMSALRFAAQPEDDLNLACLLVSPLIGWSQEELLARAVPRQGTLWRHLRHNASTPPADLAVLQNLLAKADFVTPYQLLEHLLSGPLDGRRKLLERLGGEAQDSIEELLNAALALEQQDSPSLQQFIAWFDREEGDIKRETEAGGDAVRLLTVHGAKGLQAPVVILADACADPERRQMAGSLDIPLGDVSLPLLVPRKNERWGVIEAAAQAARLVEQEEHWRLLYVAMTRAEEQLWVTGALGPRARGRIPEQSWFAAVERGMQHLGAQWCDDPHWGASMIWAGSRAYDAKAPQQDTAKTGAADVPLPAWARIKAPDEARPHRPLTPTAPGEDDLPYPPPSPAMQAAAHRGRLLHSLFERLPDLAPAARRDGALAWLARQDGLADGAAREALADCALSIIADPAHAELFGADSLAEAPIAAIVSEDVVSGVVDRLVVGSETVRLVDFKTGRVPRDVAEVPPAHLRQMAAYVAALDMIFPGRVIEAALLYTAGPRLIPLSRAILAPHAPGAKPGLAGKQ